jgi:hypothetical protein
MISRHTGQQISFEKLVLMNPNARFKFIVKGTNNETIYSMYVPANPKTGVGAIYSTWLTEEGEVDKIQQYEQSKQAAEDIVTISRNQTHRLLNGKP